MKIPRYLKISVTAFIFFVRYSLKRQKYHKIKFDTHNELQVIVCSVNNNCSIGYEHHVMTPFCFTHQHISSDPEVHSILVHNCKYMIHEYYGIYHSYTHAGSLRTRQYLRKTFDVKNYFKTPKCR